MTLKILVRRILFRVFWRVEVTLFPPFSVPGSVVNGNGPILSFSGDAEDLDGHEEDSAIDLFAQPAQASPQPTTDGEGENEEAEPEDDFNAAWEVLDLARAIYEKQKEEDDDDEVTLKLADTYIALGDVSLETGEFICCSAYGTQTLSYFRRKV
jgi:hypothetical protein